MVANSNGKAKGKIARGLASKAALCIRYDALAENDNDNEYNTDISK